MKPIKTLWTSVCLATACGLAGSAHAVPVLLSSSGILVGATGIEVTSNNVTTRYDVAFRTGTCASLFAGCDSRDDFQFKTEAEALAASQALLDTVFLDGSSGAFDSAPDTVAGCTDSVFCAVVTPYDFGLNDPGLGDMAYALNFFSTLDDFSALLALNPTDDPSAEGFIFAVWSRAATPAIVPAAPPLALAGAGWLAYAASRRRNRSGRQAPGA